MKKFIMMVLLMVSSSVFAERIGVIETSGLLFKDKLEIYAFDDPTIKGVSCYVTSPKRSLSFTDQTDASISCRKIGTIVGTLKSQRKIFGKSKSWLFKKMYVDRIYDKNRGVLIYISYTQKFSGDNANNSISVVVVK